MNKQVERMSQQVGYIRVSSVDQNTDRQLSGVELDKTFEDRCSGGTRKRPELTRCLEHLREGDVLHVHSIDRLARNLADLLKLVTDLTGKGVAVHFHKEKLNFTGETNPMQDLQLSIMGAVAQFEKSMINERQREGIAQAKAKGKAFGRPSIVTDELVSNVIELKSKGASVSGIARELDVSRNTVYAALKQVV